MRISDWSSDVCSSDLFDRHQERPIDRTIRLRNIAIHGIHQSLNRISADVIITTFQSSQSRTLYDGNIVAREIVAGEQFTNFQLNEFQQFLVVDLIDLVHIDHKGRNTDLTCEQDVFTSLRHGTVSGVNHQNSAINLITSEKQRSGKEWVRRGRYRGWP